MNNNRSNRRRGRGNNRPQGGNQINRIDSRARGNAPQLLEKYKKLAHDASLNGDRVQMEYYLQFADHYFRVIADTKARQDEQRSRRDEQQRDQSGDGEDSEDDFAGRSFDRGRSRRPEREETQSDDTENESERQEAASDYEPPQNPFTRNNRERPSATTTRRPRKPRQEASEDGNSDSSGTGTEGGKKPRRDAEPGLDPAVLPPSIGSTSEEAEEAPAPAPRRRRTTRAKPVAKDDAAKGDSPKATASKGDDETLQKVS